MRATASLHVAVREGASVAVLKKLLAEGADVNTRDPRDGETALFSAYPRSAVVRVLLDAGIDVDARAAEGRTALMAVLDRADGDRKPYVASTAIVLGAKPDLELRENDSGETALYMAVRQGFLRHARILVAAGARCDAKDRDGRPLVVCAVEDQTEASSLAAVKLLAGRKLPGSAVAAARAMAEERGWAKVVAVLERC